MRAFALGLLIGVGCLQQQAVLPGFGLSFFLIGVATVLLLLCRLQCSLRHPSRRVARAVRCTLVVAAALAFGFGWAGLLAEWRLQDALPMAWEGQDITLVGTIDSLPDPVERGVRFRFAVEQAKAADGTLLQVPARVGLGIYEYAGAAVTPLQPGERWQWTARLQRPHGNANPYVFDYEAWLLAEGVRATGSVRPVGQRRLDAFVWSAGAVIARMRGALRARILQALPAEPYAGVIAALVMGDQRAIEQSDWTIFNRTGIGHLVSISGLHITMVAALFAGLVNRLWRCSFFTRASLSLWLPAQKAAALAGLLAALVYVALAGFGIPAQRTLIMLCVVAAALWLGRITAVSQVLCVALVAVLLLDPWSVLWPGFWLSFVAIACILYSAAGRVDAHAGTVPHGWRERLTRQIKSASRTQWAITVGLVPLTMLLFSQVSLVGPMANAVAIPLVSFVITPLSLLGSVAPAPLSVPLLQAAHMLVVWLAQWLSWLSDLPLAVWQAPQPDALRFALALIGTLWLLAPRGWPMRWMGLLAWLPLALNTATAPREGVWVTAFDIGQGNALLIETATHRLLYDTGPGFSADADSGSRVLVPYLRARGISWLDGLVISHSDSDHSGGALSVLNGIEVGWVSSSLPTEHAIVQRAPYHHACVAGQSWSWDGVQFDMLQPTRDSYANADLRPNARSCTLKISVQGRAVLLTGDIEAAQERALLERMPERLSATVLLAPHHGSGTSSTPAFLAAVSPELALFQVGYRNRYKHPKAEVFERYHTLGIARLRTDESGALRIEIHEDIHVSAFRTEQARYWQGR